MPEAAISQPLSSSYASHVNPQWVRLLDILGLNVCYQRCAGAELFTSDGRRILDFLSAYCVHNTVPDSGYLRAAQDLCRRHGTLFVVDEVQRGLYSTGKFLASQHYGIEPDMVILAKALSGGLVPWGAVLTTDAIYERVYDSLKRAIIDTSTFSENGLAMRAGLATLDVLQHEKLGDRALSAAEYVRARLRASLQRFEMVADVRGAGLFSGIEFRSPSQARLRLAFETYRTIHPGLFGQLLLMRMFRELMELVHSSSAVWTEALGLARRALRI